MRFIANNKYTQQVLPRLEELRTLKAHGASIEQLAQHVQISPRSMHTYLRRAKNGDPDYAALLDLFLSDQDPNLSVEQALLRRAVGYDYTEEVYECKPDEHGVQRMMLVKQMKKHQPPDAKTAMWWLEKRDPGRWGDVTGDEDRGCGVVVLPEVIEGP